ncbi:SpaA isopeptide-forming pilin-related protein [Ligilactobacillus cholophilus]|uniref:SpaA isopeptide-forming pilin-related protein n=1 Tax=Ligilactobacillus cholophilus TaxID=3050131 RepID=UPI0025B18656|nr:SpaA isopeptide-forming pilin-related protein [Ligilactobacillus cholophilus]
MQKDIRLHLLRSIFATLGVIIGMLVFFQCRINASDVAVNGLAENQAVIKDLKGNQVSDTQELNKYEYFKVTYHWSIPDSETIESGDTVTFEIPNNIRVCSDVTFNITDAQGQTVGKAKIKANSSTGTVTFSNIPTEFRYNRHGTLTFYGEGKVEQQTDINNWMIDKGGWVNDAKIGPDGKPTQLYWNVVLNPAGKTISNVTFVDKPQNGQTIMTDTIVAYKVDGQELGEQLDPTLTQDENGNVTLNFGDINYPIYIKYQTKLSSDAVTNSTDEWENTGIINWNNTSSEKAAAIMRYGGLGVADGYDGSVELEKLSEETNQPLQGAVFNLEDEEGNVIESDLITDENGQILIANIKDGNYQFVETKAPEGYQLNTTPIKFTIDDTNPEKLHIKLTAFNQKAVSSSSSSSSILSSSSSLSSLSSIFSSSSSASSSSSILSSSSSILSSSSAISSSSSLSSSSSSASSSSSVIPSMSSSSSSSSSIIASTSSSTSVPAISSNLSSSSSSSNQPIISSSSTGQKVPVQSSQSSILSSSLPMYSSSVLPSSSSNLVPSELINSVSSSQSTITDTGKNIDDPQSSTTTKSPVISTTKAPTSFDNKNDDPVVLIGKSEKASSHVNSVKSSKNASSKASLPQTGENQKLGNTISIIGIVTMTIAAGAIIFKVK